MNISKKAQSGLSLINVLVGVTIIIIAFLGIWNVFNFSLKIIAENKARTIATAVANEKLEIIRNLPYDNIGTVGGIPSGTLPQTETITRNRAEFSVTTKIFYVDDPYDNLVPEDLLGADYKKIKISVDWPSRIFGEPVISFSTASPKGVETDTHGGTIRVIVFNASGEPVPEASVRIINNELVPPVDTSSITDQSGILLVPGAEPTDNRSYEITITKTGYTTEKTYPEIIPDFPQPTKPQLQVLEGLISEKSFTIDVVSTFNIKTISKNYPVNWKINTASTTAQQLNPDICVDNNNYYYFVWQDDKDTSSFRIYAQKYTSDKIPQWPEDKRISTANNQVVPRIATDGLNLFIAWNDDREGNQDSYLIKLDPAGNELWGGEKKINTLNQSKDQTYPAIAASKSNGDVFLTFQENSGASDNWDIYVHKYTTDGNLDPLWGTPIKVNDDATDKNQNYPQITFYEDVLNDDKVIYITWQDERNDDWDVYAQKYNATGTPLWINNIKINTDVGTANQITPKIARDSLGNIYIVWSDDRNGNWDIYLHKYDSDGNPTWVNEIKINHDTGETNQTEPAVAIDSSDNIFISWTDERYLDTRGKDIYAQKLDTDGNFLWANDELIVSDDDTNSNQSNSKITIDQNDYVIFTWEDDRDEDTDIDIFIARYQGPGTIVNVPNVPLNIKGNKQIYDVPVILKFDNNYSTNGSGNLTLTDIEWDTYTIEPQSTSTYTLISSDPPQPIIINPGETLNVELNVE